MPRRLTPFRPVARDPAGSLRVAIVGLGPKGMFALERLLDHAGHDDPAASIEVDAFEPHPVPGAGPVYDPGQPAHLRMNFTAGQVDMWWPGGAAVPVSEQRSFVDWSAARGVPSDPLGYPARADVGRYLADGLRAVLAHAPSSVTVTIRPARVRAVVRRPDGWELAVVGPSWPSDDDVAFPIRPEPYDEVLIATGHDRSAVERLDRSRPGPDAFVPAVFPVDRCLPPDRVPPGATVAIRGFALTFIDAALALTEGRGGSFEPWDAGKRDCSETDGPVPAGTCRLRYRPGDEDVRVILPFSRTGRPMLAKPAAGLGMSMPGLVTVAELGRRQLADLDAPVDLHRDLLPILAAATRANLLAAGGTARAADGVDVWLDRAAAGVTAAAGQSPVDELRRSLDVGAGLVAPDLDWALGQTWRALYPALVDRLGGAGLAPADWPAFRRLSAEFERISFGPPPVNVAKLLALVDAGRVDLTHVRGGRLARENESTMLSSERGTTPVDLVIDGVLPGPGAGGSELVNRLLDDGHVRIARGRRGIDVDHDGGCRAADGSRPPGLAAIGRPTEDSVIGNDTLSRTLHPLSDHWARRVIERAGRTPPTPVLAGVSRGAPG
jgi:uncharacterized NAD(P)/FAD-binding protein YdhS